MSTVATNLHPAHEPNGTIWSRDARLMRSCIGEVAASARKPERILIVDSDPAFREELAREFRAAGYEVVTAGTGEQAFLILRDWQHPIGWLYSRAALPGLIDWAILADQYRDIHPDRAVIVSAHHAGFSAGGDIILKEPTVAAVLKTIWHVIDTAQPKQTNRSMCVPEYRCAA